MTRYTLGWYGAEGVAWNKILELIATLAAKLAKSWGAEVTREHWDAPRFDLRWYTDDGIGRAVQVLIEGMPEHYYLRVSGSAWKDFDKDRQRRWSGQEISKIPVPLDLDQLAIGVVEDALWSARVIISNWVEADLTKESDLPQRDPNLTGTFVQGRYVP
ncbi:MAG: hypothetical protein Q8O86_04575 [Dehalococcoidia bacterium]|nr:hypothetical protein [Dehalococcoidia bacterium]